MGLKVLRGALVTDSLGRKIGNVAEVRPRRFRVALPDDTPLWVGYELIATHDVDELQLLCTFQVLLSSDSAPLTEMPL